MAFYLATYIIPIIHSRHLRRNNSVEYIEEMDAFNTCSLVTVVPFTNYSQIVTSGNVIVEYNSSSTFVSGKFTNSSTNDFISFISKSTHFPTGKPVLLSRKTSIVSGYLGYPIGTSTTDFRAVGSFPDLTQVVSAIIAAGDLCSSTDIYSTTVYTGANAANVSLTTLYKTLAASNINVNDAATIRNQIDIYQNKNKMFYSFFVFEYCYYNTMYNALLQQYFNEYTNVTPTSRLPNINYLRDSTGTQVTMASTQSAQSSRLDAIVINLARVNSRLTEMRNLLSAIQNYYSDSLQQLQATLNNANNQGSDAHAEAKVTFLKNQFPNLEKARDESEIRKGIMDYTSEKNRYSNILLGIYAFLNIAVIGIIFNIRD